MQCYRESSNHRGQKRKEKDLQKQKNTLHGGRLWSMMSLAQRCLAAGVGEAGRVAGALAGRGTALPPGGAGGADAPSLEPVSAPRAPTAAGRRVLKHYSRSRSKTRSVFTGKTPARAVSGVTAAWPSGVARGLDGAEEGILSGRGLWNLRFLCFGPQELLSCPSFPSVWSPEPPYLGGSRVQTLPPSTHPRSPAPLLSPRVTQWPGWKGASVFWGRGHPGWDPAPPHLPRPCGYRGRSGHAGSEKTLPSPAAATVPARPWSASWKHAFGARPAGTRRPPG